MKYYRLLKDTPEAPKGTVFARNGSMYRNSELSCEYWADIVEEQPEWFEEVEPIFVRPFNAEKLEEIDRIADRETDVIKPLVIEAPF